MEKLWFSTIWQLFLVFLMCVHVIVSAKANLILIIFELVIMFS